VTTDSKPSTLALSTDGGGAATTSDESRAADAKLQAARQPSRLAAVDGLRAFAALWVVLFHIRSFSGGKLPPGLNTFARSGSTGVSLFLVLSGFCLFLPFSGGRSHRFRSKDFFRRRWLRLVPAYYASIAVVVIAIVLTSGRDGLAPLSGWSLAQQTGAHVGLVQQFFPSTFYGLNGAYWSLGLEWEFYLALPLLIWTARRWGVMRTVAAVVVVNVLYRLALAGVTAGGLVASHGALATDVLPNVFLGRWGEFALGMLAAELYTTGVLPRLVHKIRWGILVLVPLALAIAGDPIAHLVFGLVFFILLCLVLTRDNVVSRAFSWKPMVILGTMSYSIYLMHTPVLEVMDARLSSLGWSPTLVCYAMIALTPVVLLVAWVLFVTVERRSVSSEALAAGPGAGLLSPRFLRRLDSIRIWPRSVRSPSLPPAKAAAPVAAMNTSAE
jgi:peptidoglycan/LPS O-acetylase OafA/YrhL